MAGRWTKKELAFLEENREDLSPKELATDLGRPIASVKKQLKKLGAMPSVDSPPIEGETTAPPSMMIDLNNMTDEQMAMLRDKLLPSEPEASPQQKTRQSRATKSRADLHDIASGSSKDNRKQSIGQQMNVGPGRPNDFETMKLSKNIKMMDAHKKDVAIDKKLAQQEPVARSERESRVELKCKGCEGWFLVHPNCVPSESGRWACNDCVVSRV